MNVCEYVKEKHKGQFRKQGTPYYLHPFAVSKILKDKGFDTEYQIAGLFHDLLEDTDTSYEEIIDISNKRTRLYKEKILWKNKKESYGENGKTCR